MVAAGVKEPPRLPHVVGVELVQDVSGIASPVEGFFRRYRHRAKSQLSDGSRTDPYVVDYIDRGPGRRNSVAVALFVLDRTHPGRSQIVLRQQLRYAVYVAAGAPMMTEVVAGIVEGDESPTRAAVREVAEETGLAIAEADVFTLGGPFYPSPAAMTEMIHMVGARLPDDALERPLPPAPGDGSAMELGARLIAVALDDALALPGGPADPDVDRVTLCDAMTEIALRRLRDHLLNRQPPEEAE